jgi:nucleotide-binding universal stress UspA family protein
MFEKIMVPLDGSLQSQAALEPAKYLARVSGARLVLVRAIGLPQEADTTPLAAVSAAAYARERIRCERYLKGIARELFQTGFKVVWETLDFREKADANLLWAIERYAVDLVVMTSHSRKGVKRVLQGSIADKLISQAPCPVLVVGKKSRNLEGFIRRPAGDHSCSE